jgi:hypothetical protein
MTTSRNHMLHTPGAIAEAMKAQQRAEVIYRNLYGPQPKRRLRVYGAEREGQFVADILNKIQGTADGEPVINLLANMQQLEDSAQLMRQKPKPRPGRRRGYLARFVKTYSKVEPMVTLVNSSLGGFPQRLQLTVTSAGRLDIDWMRGRSKASRPDETIWPMLQLVRQGYLNRIRSCQECRKWFYARFGHQTFCGTACQQKFYRSSPEWMAHRREWMRNYRQLTKSGKVKVGKG